MTKCVQGNKRQVCFKFWASGFVSIIYILLRVIFPWFIGTENKLSSYITRINHHMKVEFLWNIHGIQHSCRAPPTPPAHLELVCFPSQELDGQSKTMTAGEMIHHSARIWKVNDKQSSLIKENPQILFHDLDYNLGNKRRKHMTVSGKSLLCTVICLLCTVAEKCKCLR